MTFWYLLGYSLSKGLAKTFFNYRVIGAENLVEEGPCIIAANHCSYLDPPLVGVAFRRGIHYLARKSLLDWPVLGPIFPRLNVIPVDQKNADRSALMGAIRVVREGGAVLIFPEGTRSRDGRLQSGQAGIGMIAAKTGAPVLPARIAGSFEAFPRRGTGQRIRAVPISVSFGPLLQFGTPEGREDYARIGDQTMRAIASIPVPRQITAAE